MIRVGTIKNSNDRVNYEGFIPIVVMTKSSKYGSLSPYELKYNGMIIENIWQYAKIYKEVPASKQYYSQWDKTIIWDHPAEVHIRSKEDGSSEITEEYANWRLKGFNNPYAVRYPVGMKHRHLCMGSILDVSKPVLLNYVDARKQIYIPYYIHAVKLQSQFQELKQLLKEGKNLLIMEVDGPHEESLGYYKEKYNVKDDFITNKTMLVTKENINIMLNDTKHAFGHGYCLAMALLDMY